jgi:hypothetical protein
MVLNKMFKMLREGDGSGVAPHDLEPNVIGVGRLGTSGYGPQGPYVPNA